MSDDMSLTEFLLARFDEDRVAAVLREWHQRDCNTIPAPGSEYSYPCDCGVPERMALEVEAKRRIVEWLGHTTENEFGWDGMDWFVLKHLALPYADHSDYREEWRP